MTWGSFNWKMNFRWTHVPERENVRRNYDKTLPLRCAPSPTLLLSLSRPPARLSIPLHSTPLTCTLRLPLPLFQAAGSLASGGEAMDWIGCGEALLPLPDSLLYSFSSRLLSFFMFRLRLLAALPLSFHFLCFLLRRSLRLCLIAPVTPYRIASPLPERFDASSLLCALLFRDSVPLSSPLLFCDRLPSSRLSCPLHLISSRHSASFHSLTE